MLRKTTPIALGATLTLLGSMIALPGVAFAAPGDPVAIPDTALRNAVKAAVGHQPDNGADPTEAEMATIQNLNLSGLGVSNLQGIEYATALSSLNLSGNSVSDISLLTSLPVLASLDLSLTPVTDLTPLTGKGSLASLSLVGSNADEASAAATFASLSNLSALDVSSSQLGEEAAAAVSVQELFIDDNLMTNLNGYENLVNLKALYADNNPFENIDALDGIQLDYLRAGVTRLRDISGLSVANGQVLSEVPLSAATGTPLDVSVLGTDGEQVNLVTGDAVYDEAARTAYWAAPGEYQASWSETSGDTFQFIGNLNVDVESSTPQAVPDFVASGRVGEANLSWSQPNTNGNGDIESYTIRWSQDGYETFQEATAPATATAYVLGGLAAGDWSASVSYTTSTGVQSAPSVQDFTVIEEEYAAPTDLDGEYLPANEMNVFSWTGDATSYIVKVTDDSGVESEFVATGNTLSIPSSEFADPSRFTFTVEAGDDGGSLGAVSAVTVFNPVTGYVGPLTVGTPVTDLTVVGDAATSTATVSFTTPADAEVVKYSVIGGPTNGVVVEGTITGLVTSFDFPTVSGYAYTVVVSARTESSSFSAASETYDAPGLSSVTGLTGELGVGNVTLDWNPVAGAASYEVVILPETASAPTTVQVTDTTSVVNFADFPDGNEQFEIGVRALDGNGGRGDYSTILFVNPGAQYVGPATAMLAAPTNVSAVYSEADNTFSVTWTDDDAANRFLITLNGQEFFSPTNAISLPAGAAGTVNDIVVAQRGVGGPFGPGAAIQVTTPDDVPVVPGELTATIQGDDVLASWTPIVGAVSYSVGVGNLAANGGDGFETTETSALIPGGNLRGFVLNVTGLDADGNPIPGQYQGIYNAGSGEFLDLTAPPLTIAVGEVVADAQNVTVTWQGVDADLYRVTATDGNGGFLESGDLPADARSFSFPRSNFAPESEWTFRVQARDLSSTFNAPAEATITFPADSGNGGGNGDGGSGDGDGAGAGTGSAGAGDGSGAGTATDPIKQSGGGDMSLYAGGALALLGAALIVAPLVRRKKGLAEADPA